MKTSTIIAAARRKLNELDWIQGSFQKALGQELHFDTETTEIYHDGRRITIPISKSDAVCAMGAVEVVLANKLDLGELGRERWSLTDEYMAVNEFLKEALDPDSVPTFESLGGATQDMLRDDYQWYVDDMKGYIEYSADPSATIRPFDEWAEDRILDDYGIGADSVEDWNDQEGRTKEEVLALFDKATLLAKRAENVQLVAA